MPEFVRPGNRRQRELTLPGKWLRVDHQPRFTFRPQHVVAVQILVYQYLLPLRILQGLQCTDRPLQERSFLRPLGALVCLFQLLHPAAHLTRQRLEGYRRWSPETWQQPDYHVERDVRLLFGQVRSWIAVFNQQRVSVRVVGQQPHRPKAVAAR